MSKADEMFEELDKENYSVNINKIEQKINIFYGIILAHGTEKEKEDANIIIDWINFLEKNIGIKRCPVCNKKFTAKRKNQIYCSKDCNIKNYWGRLSEKERKEEYKKRWHNYVEKHKEQVKEYQKNYRKSKII